MTTGEDQARPAGEQVRWPGSKVWIYGYMYVYTDLYTYRCIYVCMYVNAYMCIYFCSVYVCAFWEYIFLLLQGVWTRGRGSGGTELQQPCFSQSFGSRMVYFPLTPGIAGRSQLGCEYSQNSRFSIPNMRRDLILLQMSSVRIIYQTFEIL